MESVEEKEIEELSVYGSKVEEVASFKYLGRILEASGDDGEEIRSRVMAARRAMGALSLPLYSRAAVERKTKMAVFRAVCVGHIRYAAETWTAKREGLAENTIL